MSGLRSCRRSRPSTAVATNASVFATIVTALGCDKPKIPAKVTLSIESPIGKIYEILRESPAELRLHRRRCAIGIQSLSWPRSRPSLPTQKEKLQRS